MPESVKYYPVVARILLPLQPGTVACFRASVVSRLGVLNADERLLHRFLMEYKGTTLSCDANNASHVEGCRSSILEYLTRKCNKSARFENRQLETRTEIEIDLRRVTPLIHV